MNRETSWPGSRALVIPVKPSCQDNFRISLHFSRDSVWPGNANLPIGDLQYANREIGVPRFQTTQCMPSVRCDWEAIPVQSLRLDGLPGRWPCTVLVNL